MAATESFWAQIEDNELKEVQRRNERKHQISLEGNAIDQLDSAFGYFSKKTKKTYGKESEAILEWCYCNMEIVTSLFYKSASS